MCNVTRKVIALFHTSVASCLDNSGNFTPYSCSIFFVLHPRNRDAKPRDIFLRYFYCNTPVVKVLDQDRLRCLVVMKKERKEIIYIEQPNNYNTIKKYVLSTLCNQVFFESTRFRWISNLSFFIFFYAKKAFQFQ